MRKDWNSFSEEVDNKYNKMFKSTKTAPHNRYAQSLYWCHIADAGGPLSCLAGVEVNGLITSMVKKDWKSKRLMQ